MIRLFIAIILLAVLLASGAGAAMGQPDAEPTAPWAEAPLPVSLELSLDGVETPRAADAPKLDAALTQLIAAPARERAAVAETASVRLEAGRVQVQAVTAGDEAAARAAVEASGGEVTGAFDGVLQGWVSPDALPALAAHPAVAFVQTPETADLADEEALAALTEGRAAANATAWHNAGWRGAGVKIAIIDGGFLGYSAKLGNELPSNITVRNFVDSQTNAQVDGTTAHGTACAEIIHDMAPNATLYLLKINTDIDLNEAVDYAISQGVDIISTSLTFLNVTPGDGTGRFATMAQKARNAGILWVTAAGNYREAHWSGPFRDADGDGLHEYATGVEVNVFGPGNDTAFLIPAGQTLNISMRWDDWTAVNQDLRLILLRHNGTTFEQIPTGNNPQTGQAGQRPTERLSYVTNGPAAIYGVAIQRVRGDRAVNLHLLTPNRELDRRVPSMSLGNLADVRPVLTVGAVNVVSPYLREEYSSEGPTDGPGGAPAGGFQKPDMAAFANVSTASYGARRFSGTSAAAPHIAGAAALVLNAHPSAAPTELQDYLQANAVDQGLSGPDNQFGHGRLRLPAPPGPWDYDFNAYLPLTIKQR